ncbi:MAG: hypothetical protein ACRD2L_15665 [Terriglobia bacterium]
MSRFEPDLPLEEIKTQSLGPALGSWLVEQTCSMVRVKRRRPTISFLFRLKDGVIATEDGTGISNGHEVESSLFLRN